jgi:hypothetical protein
VSGLTATMQPLIRPRRVPWWRMAWIVWRQHRLTVAGIGAVLGALALYVLVTGLQMRDAHAAAVACQPAESDLCVKHGW